MSKSENNSFFLDIPRVLCGPSDSHSQPS
jgi:hypothetical protein